MNMVLGLGSTKGTPLWSNTEQQELIQLILLIVAVVCVPWMLVAKPIWLSRKNEQISIVISQKSMSSDIRKPLLTSEIEMVEFLSFFE